MSKNLVPGVLFRLFPDCDDHHEDSHRSGDLGSAVHSGQAGVAARPDNVHSDLAADTVRLRPPSQGEEPLPPQQLLDDRVHGGTLPLLLSPDLLHRAVQ